MVDFDMPDIAYCRYIAELALDFGLKPEWSELNAWNDLTQSRLNKFESKAVHLMSVVYNSKHGEYDGNDSPRPFVGNTKQSSDSIKNALRNR